MGEMQSLKSNKYNLRILLFLLNNPSMDINQTTIRKNMGVESVRTVSIGLDTLEKLGLITRKHKLPKETIIKLTEKGKKAADLIRQLEDLLP